MDECTATEESCYYVYFIEIHVLPVQSSSLTFDNFAAIKDIIKGMMTSSECVLCPAQEGATSPWLGVLPDPCYVFYVVVFYGGLIVVIRHIHVFCYPKIIYGEMELKGPIPERKSGKDDDRININFKNCSVVCSSDKSVKVTRMFHSSKGMKIKHTNCAANGASRKKHFHFSNRKNGQTATGPFNCNGRRGSVVGADTKAPIVEVSSKRHDLKPLNLTRNEPSFEATACSEYTPSTPGSQDSGFWDKPQNCDKATCTEHAALWKNTNKQNEDTSRSNKGDCDNVISKTNVDDDRNAEDIPKPSQQATEKSVESEEVPLTSTVGGHYNDSEIHDTKLSNPIPSDGQQTDKVTQTSLYNYGANCNIDDNETEQWDTSEPLPEKKTTVPDSPSTNPKTNPNSEDPPQEGSVMKSAQLSRLSIDGASIDEADDEDGEEDEPQSEEIVMESLNLTSVDHAGSGEEQDPSACGDDDSISFHMELRSHVGLTERPLEADGGSCVTSDTDDDPDRWSKVMRVYDLVEAKIHNYPWIVGCLISNDVIEVIMNLSKTDGMTAEKAYDVIIASIPAELRPYLMVSEETPQVEVCSGDDEG